MRYHNYGFFTPGSSSFCKKPGTHSFAARPLNRTCLMALCTAPSVRLGAVDADNGASFVTSLFPGPKFSHHKVIIQPRIATTTTMPHKGEADL